MPKLKAGAVALAGAALLVALAAHGAVPIAVLILDGESGGPYHDWQRTTPVLRQELEDAGLFHVTVVTAPAAGADFSGFRPPFARFQVVVFNYDAPDDRWPPELKRSFESYMAEGGGLVAVHAADNAFPGWPAFNEMIGVAGWRGRTEDAGPMWYVTNGAVVSDRARGAAGSHGDRLP